MARRRTSGARSGRALLLLLVPVLGCQTSAAAPPAVPSWGPVRLGMKDADAWRALKRAGVGMMPRIDIRKVIEQAPAGARILPFSAKHHLCRQGTERMYFRRGGHLVHTWTPLIRCASSIGHWELRFDDNTRGLKSIRFDSVALPTTKAADELMRKVAAIYGKPHERKSFTRGRAQVWRRGGVRVWLSRYRAEGGPTNVFFSLQPGRWK